MTALRPIFADERTAAQLMSLKRAEFGDLVQRGLLPKPCDIGGHERWRVADLEKIANGETVNEYDRMDFAS